MDYFSIRKQFICPTFDLEVEEAAFFEKYYAFLDCSGVGEIIRKHIRNVDHEIDVQFPISENKLYAKLAEIHAIEGKYAPQSAFVTEVYRPEEFSMLKDRFANLDELNYLGKRMESFDTLEYDQFLIGISKPDSKEVKDLINLTFNLNHFTLCQDVSNYGKIGREYELKTEGAVPVHDEDDPKYAAIGKDLIDRGLRRSRNEVLSSTIPSMSWKNLPSPRITTTTAFSASMRNTAAAQSSSNFQMKPLPSKRLLTGSALRPPRTAPTRLPFTTSKKMTGWLVFRRSSPKKAFMRQMQC